MKNLPVEPYAARDIEAAVSKVLRGLGNPEPPLDLRDVRELQRLDRQFYSTSDTSPLREFISKVKIGAKQLALRPTLLLDVVRKAELKALFLPDRKRILIDAAVPDLKKRWVEGHEVAHSLIEWHHDFLFGDDGETLRFSCHEELEREANYGAAQLLFLQGRFAREARDLSRDIKSIKLLSKTFGNTLTTVLWRMVEEAKDGELLFGVISAHPHHPGSDFVPTDPCRYFIESPSFRSRFGSVSERFVFERIKSCSKWPKRGGPLCETEIDIVGRDGGTHRFRMEAFFNGHEALTLGVHVGPVNLAVQVP